MSLKGYLYLGAFLLFSALMASSYFYGRHTRGIECDLAASKGETNQANANTKAVTQARTNDLGTQTGVAKVQAAGVAEKAGTEVTFNKIKEGVNSYAQSQAAIPVTVGCPSVNADAEFLRLWRQANANEYTPAQSNDTR